MNSIRRHRTAAISAASAAALVPMAFVPMSSASAASGCLDTGWASTKIADGLCQVIFDVAGDYTFTAPAEITELAAVLVGGGGGGVGIYNQEDNEYGAYAGGGGEVIFVDQVDFSSPLEIEVGAGGAGYLGEEQLTGDPNGGTTTLGENEASGGGSAYGNGPFSGNGKMPYGPFLLNPVVYGAHGGGAGGDATESGGGPGLKIADIPGINTELFASPGNTAFGPGGTSVLVGGETADVAGAGGAAEASDANSGQWMGYQGRDGLVILRYSFGAENNGDGEALPETGSPVQPWTVAGALAAMLAGAVALTRRRERV